MHICGGMVLDGPPHDKLIHVLSESNLMNAVTEVSYMELSHLCEVKLNFNDRSSPSYVNLWTSFLCGAALILESWFLVWRGWF